MWKLAVWMEGSLEEEGVVPDIWVTEEHVFWPPGSNASRAMAERREPTDKWLKFKLVKVKLSSVNRKDCEDYNQTTTAEFSEEEEEVIPRRKVKRKTYENFITAGDSEMSENEEETISKLPSKHSSCSTYKATLPEPPKKIQLDSSRSPCHHPKASSTHIPSSSPSTISDSRSRSGSRSPSFQRKSPPSRHHPRASRTHIPSSPTLSMRDSRMRSRSRSPSLLRRSPPLRHHTTTSSTPITHSSRGSRSHSRSRSRKSPSPYHHPTPRAANSTQSQEGNSFPMSEGRFQKRVLYLLTDIRNTLQQVCKSYAGPESEFQVEQLKTTDELKELQERLAQEEQYKLLVSQLSKVGGINIKDNSSRVMARVMTNEVMSQMNMRGHKGKIAFQDTALFKVVSESVLKTQTGTESEVALAVSSLLKYAPDRRGGGGRKHTVKVEK